MCRLTASPKKSKWQLVTENNAGDVKYTMKQTLVSLFYLVLYYRMYGPSTHNRLTVAAKEVAKNLMFLSS